MKIANLIFDGELVNHKRVDYVEYMNKEISYYDLDIKLPTLYVGWSLIKKCNTHNDISRKLNILKHIIIPNELYWEFSFNEDKSSHIKGVDSFIKNAPLFYFSGYTYVNVDPVFLKLKNNHDVFDYLKGGVDCLYNYKNEMIYMLKDKTIFGLNLEMLKIFKFDIFELLKGLNKFITNKYINDPEGDIYIDYSKKFPDFNQIKRYIVVLLAK